MNVSIDRTIEDCSPYNRKSIVMSRGTFLVFGLVLASATCNYTNILWDHRCDGGSAVFACSIPDFLYIPGQNSSRIIESDSTAIQRISIKLDFRRRVFRPLKHSIFAYDAALHTQLKRPRAVQIIGTKMKVVEIPIDLEYGDFSYGNINYVIVPPSETAHPLRYLDLHDNEITDIRNLSTLLNLETLTLSSNRLSSITNQVFQRMTNLSTLILSMNRITEPSLSMLPARLEKLFVHMNGIKSVDFSDAYLPALEEFTVSYGYLTDLNVTAILAAAPKLKEIKLIHNDFGLEKEMSISAALNAAGVAHDEGFGKEKDDEHHHGGYLDDYDDEDDDDSFYLDRKAQFWEHTFAWLLVIGNTIVLVWAAFDYYIRKTNSV